MSNELYHYGIPGMKWGVRRYRNEDGTLTDAGKRRYVVNKHDGSLIKKSKRLKRLENQQHHYERSGNNYRARQIKRKADRERSRLINTRPETLRQGDRLRRGILIFNGLKLAYGLMSVNSISGRGSKPYTYSYGHHEGPSYGSTTYASRNSNRTYSTSISGNSRSSVPRIGQNPNHRTVNDMLGGY